MSVTQLGRWDEETLEDYFLIGKLYSIEIT